MRIGVSSACLYPMETEKAFTAIVENGITVCEIFFNASCELNPSFVNELDAIRKSGETKVISIHPMMSLAESFVLFSAYDRRYREGLEDYKRYAQIAAQLGAKYIIMHGGKPNGVLTDEQYFERFYEISRAVRENGATLLQENVVHFRAGNLGFMNKMAQYLGDEARFCLDVKQSIRGGYSPFDVLSSIGGHVKHIHISDNTPDNDCMIPLAGNFDFGAFFEKAQQNGYTGDSVIEVYRWAFDEPDELFSSHKKLCEKIF